MMSNTRVPLANGAVPPRGSRWLGPVDPNEPIMLTIHIRTQPNGASVSAGADVNDNAARNDEDARAAETDGVERVVAFTRQAGLAVVDVNQREGKVAVWSTAGTIGAAFGVGFGHYEYQGKVRRAATGPIHLASDVAEVVDEIGGLDESLPDWVSAAIVAARPKQSSAQHTVLSRILFSVAGGLVAAGVVLHWTHAFSGPIPTQVGTTAKLAVQRPAPAPFSPTQTASEGLTPQPLHAAASSADSEAVHTGVPPAAVQTVLPSRGEPAHPALPTSSVPPKAADRPAPRPAPAAHTPPQAPAPVPQAHTPPRAPAPVPQVLTPPKAPAPAAQVHTPPKALAPAPQVLMPPQPPAPIPQTHVPPQPVVPQTGTASAGKPYPLAGVGAPAAPDRAYTVRVGPVFDRDRAAVIVRQLTAGGFAQTQTSVQAGYRVVSEPLPRAAAENLRATLAGRGFRVESGPLTGDTVQLVFGVLASQRDAEALAARIAAAGYDAWIREGTVYTVSVGPYPSSSLTAITGIIKAGAPEVTVQSDPMP
ncbi:MAG TPA: SPOR domain-containing protein [bacterium]|nr:SPOR domain-containing protein [bacterium]